MFQSPQKPVKYSRAEKKNLYVNPDPKSKSCDFQAAVFIFMSRRLILNCLNYSLLHLHQSCFQLHHIRRESFVQQFLFQGTASFSQSHGGPFWNMAEKFDSVTGKINPSVEQIAIRSMTWNAAHMGWMVCGLRVFVGNWSFWLKSWCRSEVVQRSFWGRLGAEKNG